MVDTAIVDDSNLGRLIFTGTWVNAGAAPFEWNGTTHGSQTTGSQVTFQFNGTQVEVYGTIGMASNSGLPVSTYALDSAAALTYTATSTSVSTYQNQFYKSPTLQDGLHTLVITITSQGAEYWLDYLLYTPSSNDLASAAMSPSSSTSEALLTATSFAGSAASSTSSSCALANNSQSSSFPLGTIVGGVIGGFILGGLCIAGLLYYWKKGFVSVSTGGAIWSPSTAFRPMPTEAQTITPFPTSIAYPSRVYSKMLVSEQYPESSDSGSPTRGRGSPSPSLSGDFSTAHTRSTPTY